MEFEVKRVLNRKQPCIPLTPSKPAAPSRPESICSGGKQLVTSNSVKNVDCQEEIPTSIGSIDSLSASRELDSWIQSMGIKSSAENSSYPENLKVRVEWSALPCKELLALAEAASEVMGSAYRHAEDIALCNAYVTVIQDGVVGTGQGRNTYWNKVVAEFTKNSGGNPNNRSLKGLESRFGTIKKEVGLYVALLKFYLQNTESGGNEARMVLNVRSEFERRYGYTFLFEHCYEVLKVVSKFDPLYGTAEQSMTQAQPEDASGSNPSTPTGATTRFTTFPADAGSSQEPARTVRPEGQKAQKKARRSGISQSSFDSMCSKAVEFVDLYKETQTKMIERGVHMRTNMESYIKHKEQVRLDRLEEREERIMSIITIGMPEPQRLYWDQKQLEILRKRGF